MAEGSNQPLIIKRVKRGGGHPHHGGAWKVAYADFVTAMMAFFLLLWLLNSVTEEQLTGIADYFAPTNASKSSQGANAPLFGKTLTTGKMVTDGSSPGVKLALPPPSVGQGGEDLTDPKEGMTEQEFEEAMAEREQQQFEKAKEALQQAVKGIPELAKMADSLLVDNTPEGLRIQLVDSDGLAMFPRGQAAMFGHTKALLALVAQVINQMPQKVAISGHTDAVPFSEGSAYTNWELSSDRALASRRELLFRGVPAERIDRVVGKAATDPLIVEDPKNPRNRRIAIVLLRETDLAPLATSPAPVK